MPVCGNMGFGYQEMFLSWDVAHNLIPETIYSKIELNIFLSSCDVGV